MGTSEIVDCISRNSTHLLAFKAEIDKMQTNQTAIDSVINQIVVLPEDLLLQVEDFIKKNRRFGFSGKEDFLKDAAGFRLRYLNQDYEHVEFLRDKYEKAEQLIQETGMPFLGVADFLEKQLDALLEKYSEWKIKEEQ